MGMSSVRTPTQLIEETISFIVQLIVIDYRLLICTNILELIQLTCSSAFYSPDKWFQFEEFLKGMLFLNHFLLSFRARISSI